MLYHIYKTSSEKQTKNNKSNWNWDSDEEVDDLEEEQEECVYSNFSKKRRKNKSTTSNNFTIALQHNQLLDTDESDNEIFPDINNKTYDSDSIFTKSDFSTNYTVEEEDIHLNANLQDSFLTTQPIKKRKFVQVRKKNDTKINESFQVSVNVLPEKYRSLFKFSTFNKMQSMAFDTIYQSNTNCIVSSPTGSGKTVLFELGIISLMKNLNELDITNLKILYIAPTKSLCTEILNKWEKSFIDLKVGMFTGDTTYKESENIKKSNIIITTPEKWDLLTRKWEDYSKLFHLVRLILVDEIHTIGENRGATLEVILTRMNILCTNIRFIAASATIPNITDIAEWLKSSNGEPAKTLTFNDEFRQVSLEKHVYGFPFYNKNEFQKDALYNSKLSDIILNHYKRKPVLIFCPTRSSTISTAKFLCKNFPVYQLNSNEVKIIKVNDNTLRDCVSKGVAFHNAGLSLDDRNAIEQNFINGNIKILCSTSTLAVGVNLPAYMAVIKGTSIWSVHESKDYSNLDILQMIGRAGRPQFEKEGCAIIMTDSTKKEHFENLLDGNDMLESTLHLNLYEHLCSEISLQTITSVMDAIKWLRCTFLYVRYHKNPTFYGQIRRAINREQNLDTQLVSFCTTIINELIQENLVEDSNSKFVCSLYGKAMVRHYILFETMKSFIKAKNNLAVDEVLNLLVQSQEFKDVRIRHNEKRFYKEINASPLIRFPFLTDKKQSKIIDQTYQKISLLIQYELGGLEFPLFDWSFKIRATVIQDRLLVFKHCQRLLKCMIDTFINKQDGNSLKKSLFLLRCVNSNAWEDSSGIIRQLKLIGLVAYRKLINKGVTSFHDIAELSEEQIEYYLGLKIGLGRKIREDVSLLPVLKIRMKPDKYTIINNQKVEVTFKIEISADFKSVMWHGKYLSVDCEILSQEALLDFRRVSLKQLKTPKSFRVTTTIDNSSFKVFFLLNCQEIGGIGQSIEFSFEDVEDQYKKLINTSSKFTTLEKCLFVQEESSDDLLSDDSILNDLSEERRILKSKDINCKNISSQNDSDKAKLSSKHPMEERHLLSHHIENERQLLPNGNYECNHFCKDKTQCRHYCCKDGIPKNLVKVSLHSKHSTHKLATTPQYSLKQLQEYKYTDRIENKETSLGYVSTDDKVHSSSGQPRHIASIQEIALNHESDIYEEDSEKQDSCQDMSHCQLISSQDNISTIKRNRDKSPARFEIPKLSHNNNGSSISRNAPLDTDCSEVESSGVDNEENDIIHNFLGSDVEIY